MKKAWEWLKKWGGAILGALVALLLTILTLGWYARRKDQQIADAKKEAAAARDEATIAEAKREIDTLRATRVEVAKRVGEKDEAIAEIDRRLAIHEDKLLVAANKDTESLSDEERIKALKDVLGGS